MSWNMFPNGPQPALKQAAATIRGAVMRSSLVALPKIAQSDRFIAESGGQGYLLAEIEICSPR